MPAYSDTEYLLSQRNIEKLMALHMKINQIILWFKMPEHNRTKEHHTKNRNGDFTSSMLTMAAI